MTHAPSRPRRGFTILELIIGAAAAVTLAAITLPLLARQSCDNLKNTSAMNLTHLNRAHVQYAADWNDRQFTVVSDGLAVHDGDCQTFNDDFGCHPPLILGDDCEGVTHGFFFCEPDGACSDDFDLVRPINFEGPYEGNGSFRLINARGFHEYVNGRFFDPIFYAPKDEPVIGLVEPFFDVDCEYVPVPIDELFQYASSYILSPAAMYHPDVFAAEVNGGFQSPEAFPWGYQSPTVSQVIFTDQKTRMVEHHWLQNPDAPCQAPKQKGDPCQPFLFNQGFRSRPVTLFYDGSIGGLSVREAMQSDAQHVQDAGYGLWLRDTPFGHNGYFMFDSADFLSETSFHVLTAEGILGRDTLR